MLTTKKHKSVSWYLLGLFILIGTMVNAQQRKITGKIISSEDSMGLPGANVLIKGTTQGATADFDGTFTIMVSEKKPVLVFNFIGFKSKEVTIDNQTTVNVTLLPDVSALNEVIVVGYGTRKKSDMTGSVSSVKAADLTAYPVLSAEQALQGRAAGVAVQSNNGGEPGAPIKIRVRGGNSINASSDAIIVVDGFVGVTMPAPEDIVSMEVLKDASATAIYGSRGSNGVILVTTKKGKSGKTNIEINQSYSSQTVNNTVDVLNADQFTAYRKSFAPTYVRGTENTNWQDKIYRTGNVSNTQLSFSGGSEKMRYYLSGNYYKQEGVVVNSDLDRFTVLSNVDLDITDKFKVGLNLFASKSTRNGISTQTQSGGTGTADVVSSAYRFDPTLGVYNADGSFAKNPIGDEIDNPFATATENVNQTVNTSYRTNFFANYEILKGLEVRTTLGLNSTDSQVGTFLPNTLLSGKASVQGKAAIQDTKTSDFLSENYLTYKKEIGKGTLTLMGGYSYQNMKRESFSASASGFVSNSISFRNLGAGKLYLAPDSSFQEQEIVSFFGRVNYDFDDKYLITFTSRRDGSSNFSANNKYASFPSGAIGWNIGNENFLKNSKIVSNLKLRASYGATGNQAIGPYQSLAKFDPIYAIIGDEQVNAAAVTVLANPNLRWESSYQQDFGFDLGLFKNKISITADYYKTNTKDLLFRKELPRLVGLANPVQISNIGELSNTGYELGINTKNITSENFKWSTDFNISTNKNEMVSLPDDKDIFIDSAPGHFLQTATQVLRVGESVGSFYGYVYDGVIQAGQTVPKGLEKDLPGDALYRDLNGDGKITSADRTIIGDPNPKYNLGLSNTFNYKNIDLNLFFQGSVGGQILNYSLLEMASGDANPTVEALNSWTPQNTDTNIPRAAVRAKTVSSRFVYDGSYVRLKNISVGYTLPSSLIKKVGLDKVRFYVSAQNILTFTKYPGADPEVNYRNDSSERSNTNIGLDYGSYPNTKTFTMGMNLKF